MTKHILKFALCLTIIAGCTRSASAADNQLTAEEKKAGWILLFNGKNLDGWKVSDKKTSKIAAKDGTIICQGSRSHVFTVKQYTNFHFKAEVKTTPGSNSGIYFHTKYQASGWPSHGHESQVNVTQGDPVKTGSLYGVVKLYKTAAKDNEWWTQEIIVKGQHIVVKINGQKVIDYKEPKGKKGTRKLSTGSFAFQAHDPKSVVYYRNVKVLPLTETTR